MARADVIWVAVLAAALAGCSVLRVPRPYPGAPVVRAVEISGARQVDAKRIRAQLGTVATGRWPWDTPRRFDPVVWSHDLLRIPRIYEAEGFYDARVVSHEVREEGDGVVPTVVVEEGEPTRLEELELRGLGALPPEVGATARGAVAVRLGERFREADWAETKSAVLDALQDHGYATAKLDARVRVHPETRRARAVLEVSPGARYRFGPVRIVTPAPPGVPPEAILDEARRVLDPDAWYDPAALPEAQARIYQIGAFSAVEVSADAPDPATGRVPVAVAVRAGPTRTVSAGGGIALSPQRDDLHVVGEWVERPNAGLRAFRVRARAGYALVPPLALAFSATGNLPLRAEPFGELLVDVQSPRVLGASGVHLFAATELDLEVEEAYRATAIRPSAGLAWEPLPALQLEAHYRFTAARLFETPLTRDRSAAAVYGCARPCTISALELRAGWDTHRLSEPERGGWSAFLRLRGAGGPLGGGHSLVQALATMGGDRPLDREEATTIVARVLAATARATGDAPVPVFERLAGGGANMRGFGEGRLSPRMPARVGGRLAGVPVGGRGLLEGSLELRRRITSALIGVAFVDAGAVSVGPFDPGRLVSALTYAVGGGFRFPTPVGPVRIELAYRTPIGPPLPTVEAPGGADSLPSPTGCFGIGGGRRRGGGPDSPCSLHISIGEIP